MQAGKQAEPVGTQSDMHANCVQTQQGTERRTEKNVKQACTQADVQTDREKAWMHAGRQQLVDLQRGSQRQALAAPAENSAGLGGPGRRIRVRPGCLSCPSRARLFRHETRYGESDTGLGYNDSDTATRTRDSDTPARVRRLGHGLYGRSRNLRPRGRFAEKGPRSERPHKLSLPPLLPLDRRTGLKRFPPRPATVRALRRAKTARVNHRAGPDGPNRLSLPRSH